VIALLGGIRVEPESRDPDNDFGPVLRRLDAPGLVEEVADVARRLGVRPPEEIRLAFLPCCGVIAWSKSRALLLGLPLLHVLNLAELRAVLAHELAHLANGDATWSAGSVRFVERLGQALDDREGRSWGPLRLWARTCRAMASAWVAPIARGQEARADRASAAIAGGQAAASALIKVALVQPLFREVIAHQDPDLLATTNLYATFRAFWSRLPERLLESMRLRLLTVDPGPADSPHPPLPERVARIQAFPDRPDLAVENVAAISLVGDPEWLEQMLHDRLYQLPAIEPSVFHKAGS
jgi:Zn-dependent protease with chaperone function